MIDIARDVSIDYLKSKSLQPRYYDQVFQNTFNSPQSDKVLKKLELDKQNIIESAYYQGATLDEICEKLQITPEILKTTLHDILMELKDLLK